MNDGQVIETSSIYFLQILDNVIISLSFIFHSWVDEKQSFLMKNSLSIEDNWNSQKYPDASLSNQQARTK